MWRSDNGDRACFFDESCNAKVAQVCGAIFVKKYVARLQITVKDSLAMRLFQGWADSLHDFQNLVQAQWSIVQPLLQRSPRHMAHYQKRLALMLSEII